MHIELVIPSSHLILCYPFSSCPQSLPASGSFPMSQLFPSGGQSTGVSASAPVLPMNTQDWFPLEWTGWIALQSKGLSRVFSSTTVQKHQFFSAQLSSQSIWEGIRHKSSQINLEELLVRRWILFFFRSINTYWKPSSKILEAEGSIRRVIWQFK